MAETATVAVVDAANGTDAVQNVSFNAVDFSGCPSLGVNSPTNCVTQGQEGTLTSVTVRYYEGGTGAVGTPLSAHLTAASANFTASQPAGSMESTGQTANCVTNASGLCTFTIVGLGQETADLSVTYAGGTSFPSATATEAIHFVPQSVTATRLDLVSSQLIAPNNQSSAFQGFAEPGDAIQNTYYLTGGCTPQSGEANCDPSNGAGNGVTGDNGTALADTPITLSVDHGSFTPNCISPRTSDPSAGGITNYAQCGFSTIPTAGAQTGNLQNSGNTETVTTNLQGEFIVTLDIGRDPGFDDDGTVVAHVTAGALASVSPGDRTVGTSCTAGTALQPTTGDAVTPTNPGGCGVDIEWTTQEQPLNGGTARFVSVPRVTGAGSDVVPSENNFSVTDGASNNVPDDVRVDFLAHITDQFGNLTSDDASGATQPTLTKTGPGSLYLCTGESSTSACTGGSLDGSLTSEADGTTKQVDSAVVGSYLDVPLQTRYQADTTDGTINLRYPCPYGQVACSNTNVALPGTTDGTQTNVLLWTAPTSTFSVFISGSLSIAAYSSGTAVAATDTYTLSFYNQFAEPYVTFEVQPSNQVKTDTTATIQVTALDEFGVAIPNQTTSFTPGGSAGSCNGASTATTNFYGVATYNFSCSSPGTPNVTADLTDPNGFQFASGIEHITFSNTLGHSAAADFDGDGSSDLSVFRPSAGKWYVDKSSGGSSTVAWGNASDIPVAGDYDGDGKTDIAVYRPSSGKWLIQDSGGGTQSVAWGNATDIPVPGDYNGDGKTDIAVYRPSSGKWLIQDSGGGTQTIAWGNATDIPVPGDYDSDGKTDAAVYRPSSGKWLIDKTTGGTQTVAFGASSDIPVPADYNGNGKTDIAVFRPSSGKWYIDGGATTSWGTHGDIPTEVPPAIWKHYFS
jgi:hypothetical protein